MRHPSARRLPAREAYRYWAPSYDRETAVTVLDGIAVDRLCPHLEGRDLLDAGCGTGRRIPRPGPGGPRRCVGIDLVPAMLASGRAHRASGTIAAVADLCALPFRAGRFDIVWCRLAIGHVTTLEAAYRAFADVVQPGAALIVTDFHPDAAQAGHLRSFRDEHGRRWAVEHYVHRPDDHLAAAGAVGWIPEARLDLRVGPEVEGVYASAGEIDRYRRQQGMPVVLAFRFGR